MKIIYDDLCELAEAVIRCSDTVRKGRCECCPFYDRCQTDILEMRHVLCAEIEGCAKLAEKSEFDKKVNNVVRILTTPMEEGGGSDED